MDNANSKDYLEKIMIQVIENLKKTTHAPSVQMTDVPRDPLGGMTEEEEAELEDMDEDDNKDVRNTQRRWEQRITRDDELDESDDEEENKANGVHPANGGPKRKNIMDYQNPNAVADDIEVDSGVVTPDVEMEDEITPAVAAEVNAEVNDEIMENKEAESEIAEKAPSNAPSPANSPKPAENIDNDGDVDMGGTDAPVADTQPRHYHQLHQGLL
jgi:histone deacetylase 1/2